MKAVFVLPSVNLGGAERVMIRIANGFAERGIDTVLFVFTGRGPLRVEISERVRLVVFSEQGLSLLLQLRAAISLLFLLRREQPDAVFSTMFQTNMLVSSIHWLSRSRARLILREAIFVSKAWPKSRVYFLAKHLGPVLYKRADWIIAPSQDQADDICSSLGIDEKRIACISNPVIGDWIAELAEEPVAEQIGDRISPPFVLAVGRLVNQKAFDVLIQAYSKHHSKHGGTLLILGEGAEREALESMVDTLDLSDSVLLPGIDSNPFRYMRQADVFVLSSRYEGLPNALAQAVSLGVRCVATDCPSGPREVLLGGKLGQLVPVDDVAALSAAISAAVSGPAHEVPDSWLDRYDEQAVVQRYASLMERRSE